METTILLVKKIQMSYLRLVLFVFIVLLFPGNYMFAQSLSSLPHVGINKLLKEGQNLQNSDPKKALLYFTDADQKSRAVNYPEGSATALLETAYLYFGSNIDKVIEKAKEALDICTRENLLSDNLKERLHLLLAEAYDEKGRKDLSAYYFYLLSDEIENGHISDQYFKIDVYAKLIVFWAKMDYDIAYLKSTLSNYIEKAKLAANTSKDSANAAKIYFLQGIYYMAIKDFEKSRFYYEEYLLKWGNLMDTPRRMSTLLNISETYLLQHKPEPALRYIDKAAKVGSAYANTSLYLTVANFMRAKALFQQKQYVETIKLAEATLQNAKDNGLQMVAEAVEAHKIAADSYKALGQYQRALAHANEYLQLHDSLMQKDKLDMIHRLETRYKLSEKDKEITRQKLTTAEAENRIRQKNFWLFNTSFIILFLVLIFIFWYRNNSHKQKLQQEKISNIQQQMEIEKLSAAIRGEEKERARIARELHDGIGGLLTAAKLNLEMAKKEAANNGDLNSGIQLVEEAAVELRKAAHNITPEILLQEGLVEAVKYSCTSLVGKTNIDINFQVLGQPSKLDTQFELHVYRIIQELVNNILKHAQAKQAIVEISFNRDSLAVTVEDDGIGIAENKNPAKKGMGLTGIHERLKAIGGSLSIESGPGEGTSIYIEFENANQKRAII